MVPYVLFGQKRIRVAFYPEITACPLAAVCGIEGILHVSRIFEELLERDLQDEEIKALEEVMDAADGISDSETRRQLLQICGLEHDQTVQEQTVQEQTS
jgi:hypothetical protein